MDDRVAAPRLNDALEGRYGTECELGESGMSSVYLAEDLKPCIGPETLRDALDREKQLGVEEATRIVRDVPSPA